MSATRRQFLRRLTTSGLGGAALLGGLDRLGLLARLAEPVAHAASDYRALVCIFLAGGNDGNNTLVPMDSSGYAAYQSARGAAGLALAQASLAPTTITPTSLSRPFALHPSLAPLLPLWNARQLAVVANVGTLLRPLTRTEYRSGAPRPYQLFSHSDQVAQAHTAISVAPSRSGWGGRLADRLVSLNGGSDYPLATSISSSSLFTVGTSAYPIVISAAPTPLHQVLTLSGFDSGGPSTARRSALEAIRALDRDPLLVDAAAATMDQAASISSALQTDPTLATVFPTTSLANQLRQVAKLIKMGQGSLGLGRQIFFCQLGGFDTHGNQISSQQTLLSTLAAAMVAFFQATVELELQDKVTTFTLSDFGRTFAPSGTGSAVGSDHAWGNHHLVMGQAVRGGDFFGVPGPDGSVLPVFQLGGPSDADSRGRWIPTASLEQYGATLARWFGAAGSDLPHVFPGLPAFGSANLGFMA